MLKSLKNRIYNVKIGPQTICLKRTQILNIKKAARLARNPNW
jgi:hypothetical protein